MQDEQTCKQQTTMKLYIVESPHNYYYYYCNSSQLSCAWWSMTTYLSMCVTRTHIKILPTERYMIHFQA